MLLLHSNLILKASLIGGFSIRFNDNLEVANFLLGHPARVYLVLVKLSRLNCGYRFSKFYAYCATPMMVK